MNKNNFPIGVFDSGLGGLTTVKELNSILPNENITYFGDTARIPYGNKSRETVLKYAEEDIAFLKTKNVKMIIAACGTVSSLIGTGTNLSELFPNSVSDAAMPFTGVLLPAVAAACSATRMGKIGVIGTLGTIRSGAYERAIRAILPNAEIAANPCPMFVPLVENGYVNVGDPAAEMFVREYLTPVKNACVDTLILGCTHYPILKDIIGSFMGGAVKLISPGAEAAKYASLILQQENLKTGNQGLGTNTFYVSDSKEDFEQNAKRFLGEINGKSFSTMNN